MSADQALEKALARIAALEAKLAQPTQTAPQTTGIDPATFARALAADPVGTMTRMGVPVDHVSRVLVAHTLGDAAPLELRMAAQQGPLVSATQALASDLQAVRQRLETYEKRDQQAARRQSFSALAADKTKYPRLAAVMAKSPELFISEADSHQGDTAALAEAIEQRLTALAPALGAPPASNEKAENQVQSSQDKQAQSGVQVDMTPPPIPQGKPGVFTQEDHASLKERILRQFAPEELAAR